MKTIYQNIVQAKLNNEKLLAVLIDPEKFDIHEPQNFLNTLPGTVTHFFVGGSTDKNRQTIQVVKSLKKHTTLPVVLFPGDASQIAPNADALLFLSLLSGENPEYLIGQQLKSVPQLRKSLLEVIPTAYILIDGGRESAVERVSRTRSIPQNNIRKIVEIAIAGYFLGKKLIYLEAGSGAICRVSNEIIKAVKKEVYLPIIVGGGIRSKKELEKVYKAGADFVVIGTAFEEHNYKS